jgi:hypothetical protein
MAGAASGEITSTRARWVLSMCTSAGPRKPVLTVAQMAPSLFAPNHTSMYSGEFPSMTPTALPGRTPRAASFAAVTSDARSTSA